MVTDPREFSDYYRTDIELIFLDLHMPTIDGVELLRF
jgi:CheY-like chemotaxis protein